MSRRIILAAAALLLASSLPSGTALAQSPPPHKDPHSETRGFDAVAVLGYFGAVMALLAEREYDEKSRLLDRLARANIPEDLRFIIDRYSELLEALGDELAATERSLDRAEFSLDRGDRPAARRQLESASQSLGRAQRGLEDLRLATDTMVRRLGAFSLPEEAGLRQAHEQMQDLLERLDQLRAQFTANLEELEAAVENPGTEVVSPTEVDRAGAGTSVQESVPLHQASLSISSPSRAYPGRPLSLGGTVTGVDGPEPATAFLRVLLDQEVITSFSTGPTFQQEIIVPEDVLMGEHLLTLEFPAQGAYHGASTSIPVEIIQARPRLDLHSPDLNFLPRSIPISGSVLSELGPVRNAAVDLRLGGRSVSLRTDEQGRFSSSLPVSLGDLFVGSQTLEVTLRPAEPWHQTVTQQVDLFIVNVTNLSIISLVSIYLLVVAGIVWRRQRKSNSYGPVHAPATSPSDVTSALVPSPTGPTASLPYLGPDTPRGRIVGAYHRTARLLERRLAVSLQPCYTLRDFLRSTGYRGSSAFADLSEATERALYAVHGPGEEEVQQAQRLAREVEEE